MMIQQQFFVLSVDTRQWRTLSLSYTFLLPFPDHHSSVKETREKNLLSFCWTDTRPAHSVVSSFLVESAVQKECGDSEEH